MMARSRISIVLLLLSLGGSAWASPSVENPLDRAAAVFENHCVRCHSGPKAKMGLSLDRTALYRSTVNVTARTDRRRFRVSPNRPNQSLLYLILLPASKGGYRGPRMPFGENPLSEEEITAVREWIESFPGELWGAVKTEQPSPVDASGHFKSSRLGVLPTAEVPEGGMLEFRVDHRFRTDIKQAGTDNLFGLDGGAWVSLGLSYSFSNRFQAGLRRANLYQDYELHGKWTLLPDSTHSRRFRAALMVAYSRLDGESLANRDSFSFQVPLSTTIGKRFSLLAVPSYVTRTNALDAGDTRATTAVGLGLSWRVNDVISVGTEWVPQLSGVKSRYQLFSAHLSVTTSKHVFAIVLTNGSGIHTDAYLPGGDLDISSGELRLGFSISRLFDLLPGQGQ